MARAWALIGGAVVLALLAMSAVLILRSDEERPPDDTAAAPEPTPEDPTGGVAQTVPAPTITLSSAGVGPFSFGTAFAEVDQELRSQLGPPDDDSRGPDDSLCPARTLRWGALRVDFANGGGAEPLTLSGWGYSYGGDAEGSVGPELFTEEGLTLGSPRTDVEATLPPDSEAGADFYYRADDLQIGLDGPGPDGVVDYLGAGFNGCVE